MSDQNAFPHFRKLYTHSGAHYAQLLQRAHAFLRPKTYLEIGVETGLTLKFATCRTLAVDPQFKITSDVIMKKERMFFFQTTSDDFFASNDVVALAGGPIELAFLDGWHQCEHLLRDFIATEAVSSKDSVIVLHDCLPTDIYMARRWAFDTAIAKLTPTPGLWTGDVWKVLMILKKYREDLRITCVNAAPTGLVFVSHLDERTHVLRDSYEAIVEEMSALRTSEEELTQFLSDANIVDTREFETEPKFRQALFAP